MEEPSSSSANEKQGEVNIVIKTINNDVYNIPVSTSASIISLKSLIQAATAVESDRQRLIYRGRVLHDANIVQDYQIEDGHTVHMVARPANYRELQQIHQTTSPEMASPQSMAHISATGSAQSSTATAFPSSSVRYTAPTGITATTLNDSNSSSDSTTTMRSILENNLENIRQGLLTVNTIASTLDRHHRPEHTSTGERRFFVGQWVDVKDTVSQWLEATILDIDFLRRAVFVHYNGW